MRLSAMCDAAGVSCHTFADKDIDAALALPCSNSKGCMHAQSIFCLLASIQSKRRCLTLPAHACYTVRTTHTRVSEQLCSILQNHLMVMNHTLC